VSPRARITAKDIGAAIYGSAGRCAISFDGKSGAVVKKKKTIIIE